MLYSAEQAKKMSPAGETGPPGHRTSRTWRKAIGRQHDKEEVHKL